MNRAAVSLSLAWTLTAVLEQDNYCYVLVLSSGEYVAEVDVQAWACRRADRFRVALLGADKHPIDQSAAAWVEAQDEHQLGGAIVCWASERQAVAS